MSRQALVPAHYPFSDLSTRTFSLGVVAGGRVWMSGCTAGKVDKSTGRIVVQGDLIAQARIALEKTRLVLEEGGLGMHDVVTMTQYVTPAALPDLPALFEYYKVAFADTVPVIGTIVVKSLLRGAALIEIESVAGLATGNGLEYLPAASAPTIAGAREHASTLLAERGLGWGNLVRTTELVTAAAFASAGDAAGGRGPGLQVVMPRVVAAADGAQIQLTASRGSGQQVLFIAAEGDPAAGGVEDQCREIYARIGRQLEALGSSLDEVVKTTEYVTPAGIAAYRKTADVRREVFSDPYPAATGVICERLVHPDAQLAVDVIAVTKPA